MKKLITIILSLLILISTQLACSKSEVLVYAPDGAPALSLSSLINENVKNVKVNIVSSDKIQSLVTGSDKKADVCILPINMASKLIGSGDDYKMLGTITHGNFYFMSSTDMELSATSLNSLIGKTIGVMQLQNVPGITLRCVLNSYNVPYGIIEDTTNKYNDKVNLMAINKVETARTDIDLFLIPSPQADAKAQTTSLKFVGSLSELYGENGFPQAIVVVKNTLIEDNLKLVKKIVGELEEVNDFLKEESKSKICSLIHSELESGLTPVFNENNLTADSIIRSNIKFVNCENSKTTVEAFIQKLKDVEPNSVKEFNENFFYLGDL